MHENFKDLFKLIKKSIRNKVLNQTFKSYNQIEAS